MTLFTDWLKETRKLQEEAFGFDYAKFDDDATLVAYIKDMWIADIVESAELLDETTWKPWARDAPQVNRKLVLKEAVDKLHFIANIITACGFSDEELDEQYASKMQQNRDRQLRKGGYFVRGVDADKCLSCRRALDDVGVSERAPGVCVVCAP